MSSNVNTTVDVDRRLVNVALAIDAAIEGLELLDGDPLPEPLAYEALLGQLQALRYCRRIVERELNELRTDVRAVRTDT
jgi:hypothetical protein